MGKNGCSARADGAATVHTRRSGCRPHWDKLEARDLHKFRKLAGPFGAGDSRWIPFGRRPVGRDVDCSRLARERDARVWKPIAYGGGRGPRSYRYSDARDAYNRPDTRWRCGTACRSWRPSQWPPSKCPAYKQRRAAGMERNYGSKLSLICSAGHDAQQTGFGPSQ